jgi:hypothetical protein
MAAFSCGGRRGTCSAPAAATSSPSVSCSLYCLLLYSRFSSLSTILLVYGRILAPFPLFEQYRNALLSTDGSRKAKKSHRQAHLCIMFTLLLPNPSSILIF